MITKSRKSQKQDKQAIIFSICFGFILITITAFLTIANFRINQKGDELNSQREFLQIQLSELEQKRDQLQAQISAAAQDDYLEIEARERFNLKKPGEEVVAVLPPNEQQPASGSQKQWWNPLTW